MHNCEGNSLALFSVAFSVGTDCDDKQELEPALLADDIVSGRHSARDSAAEVIVFDSTGTALEDVAAASLVYERAIEAGAGLEISLTHEFKRRLTAKHKHGIDLLARKHKHLTQSPLVRSKILLRLGALTKRKELQDRRPLP